MYENFYKLKGDPFRLSPDHSFCFPHSSYEKAKAYMEYALHRAEGFVIITGKPGCGKTTLVNDLTDNLSQAKVTVATLVITQLDADDLLRMVAYSFGLTGKLSDKATIIQELTVFLTRLYQEGRHALLIVDEAQNLSISAMEELRLLTNLQFNNQPLLQIFLLGQEELRNLLQGPELVQVHQRIVAASHLEPLKEEDVGPYIRHRLSKVGWSKNPQISSTIYPLIHRFSLGIPRTINLICSRLFLHAFVEEHQKIGVNSIRTVLRELQQEQLLPSSLPAYDESEADAFSDLVDDYTSEEVPSPEAPRARDNAVNELHSSSKPMASTANTTAHGQTSTSENTRQAVLTDSHGASPDTLPVRETITLDDKGADPEQDSDQDSDQDSEQDIDSHSISLTKPPVEPDTTGPIPSEPLDPIPISTVHPLPVAPKAEDVPPEKTPIDSSGIEQVSTAAPTFPVPTKSDRRYWIISFSVAGLLAIGVIFYQGDQATFDSGSLIKRAQQLKTYISSKFISHEPAIASDKDSATRQETGPDTRQEAITPSTAQTAYTESVEALIVSDPAASDPGQQVEMTSDKVSHPMEEAKNADSIEATNDLPDTTALIVDEPGLATEESPTDNLTPEPSSVDSGETPPATATTGNTTKPSIVPARLILFPYKSMEIQPQFKVLLNEVADELKDSPYTVARIVGIVDNRGKGSSQTNRSVSIQRAEKVTRYLNDRGIAAERLRMEEYTGLQDRNLESSEKYTSPRPQRAVEVTVLTPTD